MNEFSCIAALWSCNCPWSDAVKYFTVVQTKDNIDDTWDFIWRSFQLAPGLLPSLSLRALVCIYKLSTRTNKFGHFKWISSCVKQDFLSAFFFSTLIVLYPIAIDVVSKLIVELHFAVFAHFNGYEGFQRFDTLEKTTRRSPPPRAECNSLQFSEEISQWWVHRTWEHLASDPSTGYGHVQRASCASHEF